MHHTTQHTTCKRQGAIHHMEHTTCHTQHARHVMENRTSNTQHAAWKNQRTKMCRYCTHCNRGELQTPCTRGGRVGHCQNSDSAQLDHLRNTVSVTHPNYSGCNVAIERGFCKPNKKGDQIGFSGHPQMGRLSLLETLCRKGGKRHPLDRREVSSIPSAWTLVYHDSPNPTSPSRTLAGTNSV